MFWKFNAPSSLQIDTLLQKEDVTLQELMEEEELLQECKVQNKKLIDFLIKPENLQDLVGFVVSDPPPDKDLEIRFKHANLASELLTCDVPIIVDQVASSSHLLLMLYKFLEREKPLNPLLASFVSKVFGMLVQRRSEQNWYSYQFTCFQVLDFLKSKGEFVEVAVKHIGTSAIMDLLSKLICGVDNDDQEIKRGIHEWLNDCGLIEQLIDKLSPECDSEEHSSVDQLIQEIITSTNDPNCNGSDSHSSIHQSQLLSTLESKQVVDKLMDTLLHEDHNESSVTHVINILLKLLSSKSSSRPSQSSIYQLNSIGIGQNDTSIDNENTVLRTVIDRLPDLQKILNQPPKVGVIYTSFGMDVERLGSTRLQIVSLITALIETKNIEVHSKFAALGTVKVLLDMFFKFSLNNFLHTQVCVCIVAILSQPMFEQLNDLKHSHASEGEMSEVIDGLNNNPKDFEDKLSTNKEEVETTQDVKTRESDSIIQDTDSNQYLLLKQLLIDCKLVNKILEVYSKSEGKLEGHVNHNLVGYMGHILEISNTLLTQSKEGHNSTIIQKLLMELPQEVQTDWNDFAEVSLAIENLKNKVIPLQSFKEGDMDAMADLRFNDNDFKDPEEHISGALHRLNSHMGASDSIDENTTGSIEMFEEACAQKICFDSSAFDDMWKFKEKNITFGSFSKSVDEEDSNHSSSEEEGDLDEEFDSLRSSEEKMEIECAAASESNEWSDMFSKRVGGSLEEARNPWQSAPASDTADNNSWADFGAPSPFNPFTIPPQDIDGEINSFQREALLTDLKQQQPTPSEGLEDICDVKQPNEFINHELPVESPASTAEQ